MRLYSKTKRDEARKNRQNALYLALLCPLGGLLAAVITSVFWVAISGDHPLQTAVTVLEGSSNFGSRLNRRKLTGQQPALSIDLKYDDSYSLQQQRQRALEAGVVAESKQDFVPATLTYQGESMPIDIRLKPGPVDLLSTHQWPYQVEVENDDRPLGLKRFSLYAPDEDSFLAEQMWLNHLQAEGLLARRTQLVRLSLNGSSQGLLALEDEFSKELIGTNSRPEGLFVAYVEQEAQGTEPTIEMASTRAGHIKKYAGLQRQEESAIAQLAGFSEGKLAAGSVFDLAATAKYLAIASFWPDASALHNPRTYFYYNPVTSRLEPAGYHYRPNAVPAKTASPALSQWIVRLFQDADFVTHYSRERQRMASRSYRLGMGQKLSADIETQQRLLQPAASTVTANKIEAWRSLDRQIDQTDWLMTTAKTVPLQDSSAGGLLASGKRIGAEGRSLSDPAVPQVLAGRDFLSWDETKRTFAVAPGSWSIKGDLIIPKGTSLVIGGSTQLKFDADALLLSRGALKFSGTQSGVVELLGKGTAWGGLELRNAQALSEFHHVRIQDAQGGMLVYRSPMAMTRSHITGGSARDSLKLIENTFSIANSFFENLPDDGIDTDGATGSIEHTRFSGIGGDGIDLSKSEVSASQVALYRIGDKAISVGQNSSLTGEDLVVAEATVAIASLDGSAVSLTDMKGRDVSAVGLAAYRDRLGFAESSITASDVQFENANYDAIAQSKSTIVLDGEASASNPQSSYRLYRLLGISTR